MIYFINVKRQATQALQNATCGRWFSVPVYAKIKVWQTSVNRCKIKYQEDNTMSLGKNIQYLRRQKRISQEQLAYEMSVSRQDRKSVV